MRILFIDEYGTPTIAKVDAIALNDKDLEIIGMANERTWSIYEMPSARQTIYPRSKCLSYLHRIFYDIANELELKSPLIRIDGIAGKIFEEADGE